MTQMPLKPVLTTLLSALAAYSGYWYYMSQSAEDYLRDKANTWSQAGLDFEFSDAEVSGFPYRLVITLSEPRLTYTNGLAAVHVRPDDLSIVVQPWQFEHALFFASQGTLRFRKGGSFRSAKRYEFSGASASVRMRDSGLDNLSIEAEELRMSTRNQGIAMVPVQFHWRAAEPSTGADGGLLEPPIAELAFSVGHMFLLDEERRAAIFANLSLRMTPRGPGNLAISAGSAGDLARWRNEGGTLEIDGLKADWSDGSVAASGSFTLDEEMRPLGLMSLEVTNAGELVRRLGLTGLLADSTIRALRDGVQTIAGRGLTGISTVSLTWQAGHVYIGTFEIAALDPIIKD
jgi:hypothetical protein